MELCDIYCGFLGRNERNKCGGMPKWLDMVENLWKRKVDCSKRPSKKKVEKNGLEQKQKKRKKKW